MPRKHKHLILTLPDCVYGNGPGAENHACAGLRTGMTSDEFLEGISPLFIVGGIGVYGITGYKVLDNVLASDKGNAALKNREEQAAEKDA